MYITLLNYHYLIFLNNQYLLELYDEFLEKGFVEFNSDINIDDYSMENMAKKFADLLNEINNK